LILLLLLVLIIVYFVFTVPRLHEFTTETRLLDSVINYSPAQAYQIVQDYGPAGRKFILTRILSVDFVLPFDYAFLMMMLITLIYRRWLPQGNLFSYLKVIPLIATATDYLENSGIIVMLVSYPLRLDWVAGATNVFTLLKWPLAFVSILSIVVGAVALLVGWLKKHIFNSA
jgi:uncharacterized membrane protein YeiB